jgi:MYXO-CTERM domain-containing protein
MKFNRLTIAAALFAVAVPASAVLQLSANINGALFTCADQNVVCDTNPLLGQLAIANQTFNGVEILGSSQFQIIGPSNALNTSSFQIINHNLAAATVTLAINGINFLGPVSSYTASGSGTWQNANASNIGLTYYGDATNTQGANSPLDLPGTLLATFADIANGAADAFSFNTNGAFAAGPLFGMSLGTSGTLAAWNGVAGTEPTLVGRSQTILTTQVPEPGSMALAALGLLGLGFIRKRTST